MDRMTYYEDGKAYVHAADAGLCMQIVSETDQRDFVPHSPPRFVEVIISGSLVDRLAELEDEMARLEERI